MSAVAERVLPSQGVVIAVDPHKASWTAVAVTAGLAPAGAVRVEANRAGYRQLRRFAAAWRDVVGRSRARPGWVRRWLNGCVQDGITVVDVPAKLARRVRLLSTGHGRKSDPADALSVGIAAWSAPALRTVEIDQAIAALRALTEHRDDLVRTRTQLVNRLHVLLVKLVPYRARPRTDRRVGRRGAAPRPAARHPRPHVARARRRPGRRAAPP